MISASLFRKRAGASLRRSFTTTSIRNMKVLAVLCGPYLSRRDQVSPLTAAHWQTPAASQLRKSLVCSAPPRTNLVSRSGSRTMAINSSAPQTKRGYVPNLTRHGMVAAQLSPASSCSPTQCSRRKLWMLVRLLLRCFYFFPQS